MEVIVNNLLTIVLFILLTAVSFWVSKKSLRNPQAHGFFRFFSWEAILLLLLLNGRYWFHEPFSFRQIISWILLSQSIVFIFEGVRIISLHGNLDEERDEPGLVGIEKTTKLVTTGLYRYIRHPFYSSLIFLTWGIFLKYISWPGVVLAMTSTLFIVITAKKEEIENISYFGAEYRRYMKKTKMFIPFLI